MRSQDICDALRRRYPAGECVLVFEVADGTGFNVKRHADAVMMNMWPSRGLSIEGFEIKVSKQDLKRELLEPAKAEAIAQYCDCWWLVVPQSMSVEPDDIPVAWGLMKVGADLKITVSRQAARHQRQDILPRHFVAALLRAGQAIQVRSHDAAVREAVERELKWKMDAAKERLERGATGAERISAILDAAGVQIDGWKNTPEKMAETLKLLMKVQEVTPGAFTHAAAAEAHAKEAAAATAEMFQSLGIELPPIPAYYLPEKPKKRSKP
ncbi:hypothetical protein EOD42_22180 [Rhodovarius crocodyli]|uniref:MmcB family DNA repair protein n=1 Tax=Rhodovarius crocodyli TaxID=1979269 RepID=A0A437M1A4_9PROT|nr:hypothetical protein [Rhodovarius crocodyli]RVT91365.1 hypothetical protein EOD42_22180 [Rhodovarius crocodyli]